MADTTMAEKPQLTVAEIDEALAKKKARYRALRDQHVKIAAEQQTLAEEINELAKAREEISPWRGDAKSLAEHEARINRRRR